MEGVVSIIGSASLREVTSRIRSKNSDETLAVTQSSAGWNVRKSALAGDQALGRRINDLFTFSGCEHLLRGIDLQGVVAAGGRILQNSHSSKSVYALSKPVDRLNMFVSHNWAVTRLRKFIALAFTFNFVPASLFLAFVMVVVGVLTTLGYVPLVHDEVFGVEVGFLGRLVNGPILLLGIFFIRWPLALLGMPGPTMFLDKACISQDDDEVQRAGIAKLGAFLAQSDKMLILYSPIYLTKLWTVYEVASFCSFHTMNEIIVVPVERPFLFVIIITFMWLYSLILLVMRMFTHNYILVYPLAILSAIFCVVALRKDARRRAMMLTRLRSFNVHEAKCAVESDRAFVYQNIVSLMQAAKVVGEGEDVEDAALSAFNRLVRRELPSAFKASVGRFSFTYMQYILIGGICGGFHAVDYSSVIHQGEDGRTVAAMFVYYLWLFAGLWPSVFFFLDVIAERKMQWQGCKEVAFILGGVFAEATVMVSLNALARGLEAWASTSDLALAVLSLFVAACLLLFAALYRLMSRASAPRSAEGLRPGDSSEGSSEDIIFELSQGKPERLSFHCLQHRLDRDMAGADPEPAEPAEPAEAAAAAAVAEVGAAGEAKAAPSPAQVEIISWPEDVVRAKV